MISISDFIRGVTELNFIWGIFALTAFFTSVTVTE